MEWIDIYIFLGHTTRGEDAGLGECVTGHVILVWTYAGIVQRRESLLFGKTLPHRTHANLVGNKREDKEKKRISLETLNALECRLTGFEMGEINLRGSSSIRWSFDKRSSTFGMYLCLSVEGNFFCARVARPTCCQTSNAGQHAWFSVADGKDDKVLNFGDAKLNCVVHNSLGGLKGAPQEMSLPACLRNKLLGIQKPLQPKLTCTNSWCQTSPLPPNLLSPPRAEEGVQCGGSQALASKSSRNSLCMGTRPSCLMLQKCWTARAAVWRRSGRVMISLPARRVSSGWWVAS